MNLTPQPSHPLLSMFPEVVQKLLVQEMRTQRGFLNAMFLIWLGGLWIMVLFSHPGWLLALGLLYVVLAAPARAGVDVLDGTEEFSFSLPPGRGPLYIARALPGVAFILVSGIAGGLSIALDLPQMLWSLVFSGGLTESFAPVDGKFFWYALAVVFPLLAHAITFFVAANATARATVSGSWMLGVVGALLMAFGVALLEGLLWSEPNGLLAGPVLLSAAILIHLAGYRAYLGKEATRSGGQVSPGKSWGVTAVVIMVVVLLLVFLSFFWVKESKGEAAKGAVRLHSQRAEENVVRTVEALDSPVAPSANPEPEDSPRTPEKLEKPAETESSEPAKSTEQP